SAWALTRLTRPHYTAGSGHSSHSSPASAGRTRPTISRPDTTPSASAPPVGTGTATCYFGSDSGSVFAVDVASGNLAWARNTGGSPAPTVIRGIVYAGGGNGILYALDAATSSVRWKSDIGGNVTSPPTVTGGIVYADIGGGTVNAVSAATGKTLWNYSGGGTSAASRTPPVVGSLVYTYGDNSIVCALDAASGKIRWQ